MTSVCFDFEKANKLLNAIAKKVNLTKAEYEAEDASVTKEIK